MKPIIFLFSFLLVCSIVSAADCVYPRPNMKITGYTKLCCGIYDLDAPIILTGQMPFLDCNYATLRFTSEQMILVDTKMNQGKVDVWNCNIIDKTPSNNSRFNPMITSYSNKYLTGDITIKNNVFIMNNTESVILTIPSMIWTTKSQTSFNIDGNTMVNGAYPILFLGGADPYTSGILKITNNKILFPKYSGIQIEAGRLTPIIENNIIIAKMKQQSRFVGIYFGDQEVVMYGNKISLVRNNTIFTSGEYASGIEYWLGGVNISDNKVINTYEKAGTGISLLPMWWTEPVRQYVSNNLISNFDEAFYIDENQNADEQNIFIYHNNIINNNRDFRDTEEYVVDWVYNFTYNNEGNYWDDFICGGTITNNMCSVAKRLKGKSKYDGYDYNPYMCYNGWSGCEDFNVNDFVRETYDRETQIHYHTCSGGN